MVDSAGFPYSNFSDIRIHSSEPMSYAYFNSHVARLCSNLQSMSESFTLQRATYTQWGVVKFATVDDIIASNGNKETVMSNATLNDAFSKLRSDNINGYMLKKHLDFTKNYEFVTGDFIVGTDERLAKRITDAPDRVVYANVTFVPLGYESMPFSMARVDTVPLSAYESGIQSYGMVNFVDWGAPPEYEEFHVYYHKSGYVICDNAKYNDSQRQIKVIWTLFMRKDVD